VTHKKDAQGAQVTFRLPPELDEQMRATSRYFRRSLTEEWRAAGIVYQRLLGLWVATRGGTTIGGAGAAELVTALCDGVMLEPQSLEDLRSMLRAGSRLE
jgi:hypothetical protein